MNSVLDLSAESLERIRNGNHHPKSPRDAKRVYLIRGTQHLVACNRRRGHHEAQQERGDFLALSTALGNIHEITKARTVAVDPYVISLQHL